jgi:hypothetical protein
VVAVAAVAAVGEEEGEEGAVAAWGAEAEVVVAPRQPERKLVVVGQSPRGPWGARPSRQSQVRTAREPEPRVGERRAAAAPQSAGLSGPAARSFSVVAVAVAVAVVE